MKFLNHCLPAVITELFSSATRALYVSDSKNTVKAIFKSAWAQQMLTGVQTENLSLSKILDYCFIMYWDN